MNTGFMHLDKLIGGFSGGQLTIVGGRPGMGKTTFLINIAKHAVRNECVTTAFFPWR